jgi:predicted cupin superfamily sugar epimerase
MSDSPLGPDELITLLELEPHPEGGRYAETWRATAPVGVRASGTAIYFMLREGEVSHWHRVDATEIWHHYAGAPLALSTADDNGRVDRRILGIDLAAGQRPQAVVEPNQWQSATSLGAWTLVGCTVSPGFEFAGFELAPTDWSPPGTVDHAGR